MGRLGEACEECGRGGTVEAVIVIKHSDPHEKPDRENPLGCTKGRANASARLWPASHVNRAWRAIARAAPTRAYQLQSSWIGPYRSCVAANGTYSNPRPSGSSRRTVVQSMPSAE